MLAIDFACSALLPNEKSRSSTFCFLVQEPVSQSSIFPSGPIPARSPLEAFQAKINYTHR